MSPPASPSSDALPEGDLRSSPPALDDEGLLPIPPESPPSEPVVYLRIADAGPELVVLGRCYTFIVLASKAMDERIDPYAL